MRTGLTKRQKTTGIFFDEQSSIIEVQTHNTDLKKSWEHTPSSTLACAGRRMTMGRAE